MLLNIAGGEYDEYGYTLVHARKWTGNIVEGMAVSQDTGTNMAVRVAPGTALIPTGTYPTSYTYQVAIDTASPGESVTIGTAPTSNSRIDAIVGYIDKSVTPTTSPVNNANLIFKLAAVQGTVAASPSAPTGAQIQTAIGAANPYIIFANVTVGTNVTQIVNSNISDKRTFIQPNSSVILPSNQLSNPYKFYVYRSAALNSPSNTTAVIALDTKTSPGFDTGSNVDVTTNKGRFTATIAGYYWFSAAVNVAQASGEHGNIQLNKNGTIAIEGTEFTAGNSTNQCFTVSGMIKLAANDYVEPVLFTSVSRVINIGSSTAYFQGSLMSAT